MDLCAKFGTDRSSRFTVMVRDTYRDYNFIYIDRQIDRYVAYSMHALKDIQLRRRYKPEPKIRAKWARQITAKYKLQISFFKGSVISVQNVYANQKLFVQQGFYIGQKKYRKKWTDHHEKKNLECYQNYELGFIFFFIFFIFFIFFLPYVNTLLNK